MLVRVPWSGRVWACPFLTALGRPDKEEASPSSETPPPAKKTKKTKPPRRTQTKYRYRDASGHKTSMDWIRQMLKQVRRWYRQHPLVLIVDGGLVSFGLGWSCVEIGATMVSRLRWDAALYHEPPKRRPPGQRGRHPKKGKRQRSLVEWAKRADTPWVEEESTGMEGKRKSCGCFPIRPCGIPPDGIRCRSVLS